jgi:putative ABC transport system ATP-binding protein
MDTAVLRGVELVKVFGTGAGAVRAVDGVSLEVVPGEVVLIKGPSGSGKTTLLSMLGALMRPTAGHVELEGRDISVMSQSDSARMRARRIGFVFQAYNLLGALNVEENILFPARLAGGPMGAACRRAAELVERLGLAHRRNALPEQLSGGEKQRVAIARALVNDPPLVLADEPTGNLDSQRGQEVAMLLHDIARDEHRAVVIVTHDPRIEDVADRLLWLEDGKLRDRRQEVHEWVRDPVCGMSLDRWTATLAARHDGADYYFCSERCRHRFELAPERFVVRA